MRSSTLLTLAALASLALLAGCEEKSDDAYYYLHSHTVYCQEILPYLGAGPVVHPRELRRIEDLLLDRLAVDLDAAVSFPNPLSRGAWCRGDLEYEDYGLEVWEVACQYAPFEYAYLTCEVDTY